MLIDTNCFDNAACFQLILNVLIYITVCNVLIEISPVFISNFCCNTVIQKMNTVNENIIIIKITLEALMLINNLTIFTVLAIVLVRLTRNNDCIITV